MSRPTHAALVRPTSSLDHDELVRRTRERAPRFRALEGLEQKYHQHDPTTGEYGGFYVRRSIDDVKEYRESELAATIASADEGIGTPEVTVYEILMPLRD